MPQSNKYTRLINNQYLKPTNKQKNARFILRYKVIMCICLLVCLLVFFLRAPNRCYSALYCSIALHVCYGAYHVNVCYGVYLVSVCYGVYLVNVCYGVYLVSVCYGAYHVSVCILHTS